MAAIGVLFTLIGAYIGERIQLGPPPKAGRLSGAGERHAFDVVVAGGGPGGAVTAARLAGKGRRVLVLERDTFPRFHLGESLLPDSMPILDALGVLPAIDARFLRKPGAVFHDSRTGRRARFDFGEAFHAKSPYAYQVPRDEFDALLLSHAAARGGGRPARVVGRAGPLRRDARRGGRRDRPGRGVARHRRAPRGRRDGSRRAPGARLSHDRSHRGAREHALFSQWRGVDATGRDRGGGLSPRHLRRRRGGEGGRPLGRGAPRVVLVHPVQGRPDERRRRGLARLDAPPPGPGPAGALRARHRRVEGRDPLPRARRAAMAGARRPPTSASR